ncbi:MAG TPA: LptE family protein [Flavobacteriaceae bacterium]|nr:LptE family protein [Flavobacteriaceae bacterium]
MKTKAYIHITLLTLLVLQGCGIYSFTGASVAPNINTFQVNFFRNNAAIVEPGIDREFTQRLQDLISSQTSLNLTNNNGDLIYEGEIVDYYISPMTSTSQNTAAQNRLTIVVNVRFYDTKNENNDLEQRFSFYYDYPATAQLVGAVKENALNEIFERITQDIFTATLAKW